MDAIKFIKEDVEKLRNLIMTIRCSQRLWAQFKQVQVRLGNANPKEPPCLDVETRWNSLYDMVQKSFEVKPTLE